MFSERRGRRSLHPNIQQIDKPEFMVLFEIGLTANAMLCIAGERIATSLRSSQ